MPIINLAADYGWGPYTLLLIFIVTIVVLTIGFFIVMATTRAKSQSFASKSKYHPEAYWSIGVAAVLIWLWIISYPWMPPVASSSINPSTEHIQVVNVTAGQFFWLLNRADQPLSQTNPGDSPRVTVAAGQPVKFVAHSIDVNHGFGIFSGSNDGSPILLQMQVIPKIENVFYYTFKTPGIYFIRCLEYCGMAHPYMTSEIKVVSPQMYSHNNATNPSNTTTNNPSSAI